MLTEVKISSPPAPVSELSLLKRPLFGRFENNFRSVAHLIARVFCVEVPDGDVFWVSCAKENQAIPQNETRPRPLRVHDHHVGQPGGCDFLTLPIAESVPNKSNPLRSIVDHQSLCFAVRRLRRGDNNFNGKSHNRTFRESIGNGHSQLEVRNRPIGSGRRDAETAE